MVEELGKTPSAEEIERYRLAFSESPVGILIISFETGRYVDANRAECEFLEMTREELLASDPYALWVSVTHPDDYDAERLLLQRVVDGEVNSYRIKKRYLLKSGVERWADVTATVVRDERQRVRYLVTHITDITAREQAFEARRELEARLHQSQKLETIGRLVGGVAHDFNNRLLVIMGHAELLKRGAAGSTLLEGHADVVISSARRAADLTRQLLAYGRLQVLNPRPVDLNRVVDGLRRMLERLIGERIELVTVLGAKAPIQADAGQIEQVLLNLVLNARDAMPDGGRVTVETADAELGPESAGHDVPEGSYVALSVTDTGTGIPEGVRDRLFEPFFTTKGIGKGTGLGLSTVEGIVRQSGGAIALKSIEGKGTTFTVYLPLAKEAAPEAPVAQPAPAAALSGVETVLVVDDEDEVRRLLVDVLRIGAYEVLEARDGEHALEVASRHSGPIHLVVTDLVMPNLSGTELADKLRVRRPDLKILFMSGYAESERVRNLGPNERFITKPFLPTDLFLKVNAFLREGAPAPIEQTG